MCVELFEQDLSHPVRSELISRLRAVPADPLPFPDGIAAFYNTAQPEEIPQDGAQQCERPDERVLPFIIARPQSTVPHEVGFCCRRRSGSANRLDAHRAWR